MNKNKLLTITDWIARLISSVILIQTLFFKFTGAEESRYIFTEMGIEPWGRFVVATIELIIGIALLFPKFSFYAAIAGALTMAGAIFGHIFVLGIVIKEDGGLLFSMAVLVFISCCYSVLVNAKKNSE